MSLGLELNCPLVCLDVETTGTSIKVDRVVQIGLIKLYPEGRETEWETLIDPHEPIPPEAIAIHGITDERVKGAPTFEEMAPSLARGLSGCDFAGYNVTFDLGILAEEFRRVHARPEQILNGRILDAFKITTRYNPRDLSWAVKRYTGQEHAGAHDALSDVRGTLAALRGQLEEHSLPRNMEDLHRIFFETPRDNAVDADAKLVYRHGKVTINFGKNAGVALDAIDRGFLAWMLRGEFTPIVKNTVREELERRTQ